MFTQKEITYILLSPKGKVEEIYIFSNLLGTKYNLIQYNINGSLFQEQNSAAILQNNRNCLKQDLRILFPPRSKHLSSLEIGFIASP